MKLATYKDGSRDGQLVVVSRDLSQAHFATATATRLQQVLDDWNFLSPQLQDLYVSLNQGRARHAFGFDPRQCMAPLPRAYQWVESSAYQHPVELLAQAAEQELPASDTSDPLLVQAGSDDFLGPCDPAWFGAESWGADFGAGLAVITDDIAMGADPDQALDGVRLVMLANSWRLCQQSAADLTAGSGLLHSMTAAAFSPVAVTPDELGPAWTGGRVHLTLQSALNGKKVGLCEAGPEMSFPFGQLISHLAKTRRLRSGSIVGSGPVSNRDGAKGYSCIAAKRAVETLLHGQPRSDYLRPGDTIRIEMKGRDGLSVFGAIEQQVSGPLDLSADPTLTDETGLAGDEA
ncbi:MAG: fumarylacetoacetate hydrolase [Betaproteobacteria bacterium]|nr:fumarylacetoacetate hydrolase [Betaproteobacteria bacterium]